MEWLNYHHLLYFWTVAREGSIRAASDELRLAPSTISAQLKQLQEQLGHPLLKRTGRNLVLTEMGRTVYQYADEIFMIGRELMDFVHGRQDGRPRRLDVGVSGMLPKTVALKLLEPALDGDEPVHLVVREDRQAQLLAELALHQLDVVITDVPVGPDARVKAYNHLLGECGVVFVAPEDTAERYLDDFPRSLDAAPFLYPSSESAMRRMLDHWFEARDIHPIVAAEFDDSALMKAFGQSGMGVFAVPAIVVEEVERSYRVKRIGMAEGLVERFYAVSIERRLKHPAVAEIKRRAPDSFGESG